MAQDKKRLQFILDMVDNLTAPAAKATKTIQGLGADTIATQKKLANLNKTAANIRGFQEMKAQMEANDRTGKELADEVGRLRVQMALVEKPTKAMKAALRDAEKAQAAHTKTSTAHKRELDRVEESLKRSGISTKNLGQAERNTRDAIVRTNEALSKQRDALDNATKAKERHDKAMEVSQKVAAAGAGAMLAGGATGAASYAFGSAYSKLDAGMGRMQAKGGFDDTQKEALEKWTSATAAKSSFNSEQVAAMGTYLAGAGKQDSISTIGQHYVKLAESNDIGVEDAGNYGTNIMAATGMDDSRTQEIFDKITRLGQISKTNIAEMNEGLVKLGPVAKAYNQSFDDMAVAVAMFNDAGISGSEGATALASGMNNIIAGSKVAKASMAALGVQATDSAGKMRQAPALLAEIFEATRNMSDDKKAAHLRDIFGVEHLPKMMMMMEGMAKGNYSKLMADYASFSGSMDRAQQALMNNLEGDLKYLDSSVSGIRERYGKQLNGLYRDVVQTVTRITDSISGWMDENPKVVKAIGYTVTAISALLAASGMLLLALAPMIMMWAKWKLVAYFLPIAIGAVTKAVSLLNLALLKNPIVAFAAALVAAGMLIYKYWDELSAFFGGMFTGLSYHIESVISRFKEWYDQTGALQEVFRVVAGAISHAWEWVKRLFGATDEAGRSMEGWAAAGQVAGEVLGMVFKGMTLPLAVLGNMFNWVLTTLFDFIDAVTTDPTAALMGIWQPIQEFFTDLWTAPLDTFNAMVDGVIAKATGAIDYLKGWFDWGGSSKITAVTEGLPAPDAGDKAAVDGKPLAKGGQLKPIQPITNHNSYAPQIKADFHGVDPKVMWDEFERRMAKIERDGQRKMNGGFYDRG